LSEKTGVATFWAIFSKTRPVALPLTYNSGNRFLGGAASTRFRSRFFVGKKIDVSEEAEVKERATLRAHLLLETF
jgi:hypothetical protein